MATRRMRLVSLITFLPAEREGSLYFTRSRRVLPCCAHSVKGAGKDVTPETSLQIFYSKFVELEVTTGCFSKLLVFLVTGRYVTITVFDKTFY